ncbi:MAG: NADH-quinone oxidoreductase subunit C [Armatimonadetes bacterium]|nr:NADH-quinone oxidoreductase subunit C [Armatimonadota bacterium]NIO75062.1 NADH-quinone oxidoreductase subunit C [Armatimonadota bacterium]NIO95712.1 NADH-quinone oxidoreductase subunit C [Armatimonadota bacterium]
MLAELKEEFADGVLEGSEEGNQTTLTIRPSLLLDVSQHIRGAGFEYPADITAVDDGESLCAVYRIYSVERNHHVVLKVPVARKGGRLPTVSHIWKGANWFEREVFDLFGVVFEGHPDLRRILLPADWEGGHPLLKE